MGKIFILIGKSASGKDAIYKYLLQDCGPGLKPYVGYTTRPARDGEVHGREYFFSGPEELAVYEKSGKLIEKRTYHTVHGDWIYFSVDDGSIDTEQNNYLYIGTLESFVALRDYYGAQKVIPVYVEVEDGERLARALKRERMQPQPKYAEMCRRFLEDEKDFSEEKLQEAGITRRFKNEEFESCIKEIADFIKSQGVR